MSQYTIITVSRTIRHFDLPARLDAVLAADPDHPLPEAARIALGRHLRRVRIILLELYPEMQLI